MKLKKEIIATLTKYDYCGSIVKIYNNTKSSRYQGLNLIVPYKKDIIKITCAMDYKKSIQNGTSNKFVDIFISIKQNKNENDEGHLFTEEGVPLYACSAFFYILFAKAILINEYDIELMNLIDEKKGADYEVGMMEFLKMSLDKQNSLKQDKLIDILIHISKNGTNETSKNMAIEADVLDGYKIVETSLKPA